jgi:hypothetical protein
MTKTSEEVVERLGQMPEERQDLLARLMPHEIEEDERWQRSTETHATQLQGLIQDVLEADRRGECDPLDPDRL